jgi:hypothetical protein
MQHEDGTNMRVGDAALGSFGHAQQHAQKFPAAGSSEIGAVESPLKGARQGIPAAGVMLRLRSCYVSKAAILRCRYSVSVENRSPA